VTRPVRVRGRIVVGVLAAVLGGMVCAALVAQQQPAADPSEARLRVDEQLKALRQEADRLARQSRSLLGDVRKLEVQRDIRQAEAREADRALAAAKEDFSNLSQRLEALEEQRLKGLPDLKAQLVETYKRGRSGHLRLLVSAGDLRGFARATRAVTALAFRQERVLSDYRLTLEALRTERATQQSKLAELRAKDAATRRARALAQQAVTERAVLIEQIDSRRDLTAQYVGELQVARDRLDQQIAGLSAERRVPVAVPLAPFRGGLEWPVRGEVAARFGQPTGRQGGPLVRSGMEISAPEGTGVQAVHGVFGA